KFIKVCVAYNYMGQEVTHLPYDLNQSLLNPVYVTLEGWEEDISNITSKDEIPSQFNKFISFLENELKVPVSIISIGPDRSQTIFR
ncbi:MAG: adenylosuccinate synthase, partial [Flavobacteriales bacterium TMED191]